MKSSLVSSPLHDSPIVAGDVRVLSAGLACVTAPNPGVMTGPGTNSYIVGEGELAIIDPGPDLPEHIEALESAIQQLGGTLSTIFVTHTHPDHSPAAKILAEKTGAKLIGQKIEQDGFQDASFTPDQEAEDGHRYSIGDHGVVAIYTPGHVDNHFCYLHEGSGAVITGDHIMEGSTVVIIPPAGNMADYIRSLKHLLDFPIKALAPGHGQLILEPIKEVEALVAHRLKREAKVVEVVSQLKQGSLESLTPPIYDDVDPSLHSVAQYSLWSHLLKLKEEGKVQEMGDQWQWVEG